MNRKKNYLSILFLLGVLMFSSGCVGCGNWPFRACVKTPVTLVVWNLWDDEKSWKEMINSYVKSVAADETRTPVKIIYYKKIYEGNGKYEDEVDAALIKGEALDIFTISNSWLERYKYKISPLDADAKTVSNYQRKFVDVVSFDFLEENKIYAVPLALDTLALYYNVDLLKLAGLYDPPRTWNEFNEYVKKLTVLDSNGAIVRAGAAIGFDKNINRSSDMLSLLLLQSNSTIVDEAKGVATFTALEEGSSKKKELRRTVGGRVLQFYTDFANPAKLVYTWNPLMDYSIDAFYQMKAAMMFNYAYTVPTVRAKAPKLNFAVAPMPQIDGVTVPVNYANYWAMVVSSGSKHKTEAWDFLMYLANPEVNKKYLTVTAKPAAQRDLVSWQENGEDLNLGVFARQSITAKHWYQKDSFAVETIFNDAINSVVMGRSVPESASDLAASQLTQIMKK